MVLTYPRDLRQMLQKKALTGELYRNLFTAKDFFYDFPIHSPVRSMAKTVLPSEHDQFFLWMKSWNQVAEAFPGAVQKRGRRVGSLGSIPLPSRIKLSAEQSVRFGDLQSQAHILEKCLTLTQTNADFLYDWVLSQATYFTRQDAAQKLPAWIAAGQWIQEKNQQHVVSIRELQIPGVDTKFIENNMEKFRSLYAFVTQKTLATKQEVLEAMGVESYPEDSAFVKIRMPDPALRITGLPLISLPYTDMDKLILRPKYVFLIENKATFYHFPDVKDSLIIFGSGYACSGWLKESLPLLAKAQVYYWSDLDNDGFRMLSRLRTQYPSLKSFFMDSFAVELGRKYAVKDMGTQEKDLPNLTVDERQAFDFLYENRLRIEQERLPWREIRNHLREKLGESTLMEHN